jgi:transcriptional regulator with XRE-family HTH domain
MPAPSPAVGPEVEERLKALGIALRAHRKAQRVSVTAAAEAAGMSRVTWGRIERGEPSVAMGAWLAAAAAVGLDVRWVDPAATTSSTAPAAEPMPATLRLDRFPALHALAWQREGADTVTPEEALSLYERNWRHVDVDRLTADERAFIDALAARSGRRSLLV